MSDNKKYYYLKLKDNFFDRSEIKTIEGMQNGHEYICIMQKMYLRSLSREGKLMLTDTVPYDIQMLSMVLNHRDDTIRAAIEVFCRLGLCEIMTDKTMYMTEIQNFIGTSSTEGDRKKIYRERIKQHQQITADKCPDKRPPNVPLKRDIRPPELELEKEKELELEKEKELELEKEKEKKAPQLPEIPAPFSLDAELFNETLKLFHKGHEQRTGIKALANYKKEGGCVKKIIDIAKKTAPGGGGDFILKMCREFWSMTESGSRYFRETPFIPSKLLGNWEAVLQSMNKNYVSPEQEKELVEWAKNIKWGGSVV